MEITAWLPTVLASGYIAFAVLGALVLAVPANRNEMFSGRVARLRLLHALATLTLLFVCGLAAVLGLGVAPALAWAVFASVLVGKAFSLGLGVRSRCWVCGFAGIGAIAFCTVVIARLWQ